jgi:hypothetical protein
LPKSNLVCHLSVAFCGGEMNVFSALTGFAAPAIGDDELLHQD